MGYSSSITQISQKAAADNTALAAAGIAVVTMSAKRAEETHQSNLELVGANDELGLANQALVEQWEARSESSRGSSERSSRQSSPKSSMSEIHPCLHDQTKVEIGELALAKNLEPPLAEQMPGTNPLDVAQEKDRMRTYLM